MISSIVFGFCIGLFSAFIGYGFFTWQYWFITMPIVIAFSLIIAKKGRR